LLISKITILWLTNWVFSTYQIPKKTKIASLSKSQYKNVENDDIKKQDPIGQILMMLTNQRPQMLKIDALKKTICTKAQRS